MIKKIELNAFDPKFSDLNPLAKAIGNMKKLEHFRLDLF